MAIINPDQIYKIWLAKFKDHRYLRKNRWLEISNVLRRNSIKSVLEFGSGISTVLFDNYGMIVDSLETDVEYMEQVKEMCSKNVRFHAWNNKEMPLVRQHYDLALVDGDLPRMLQLKVALRRADFVAIDDFAGRIRNSMTPLVADFERLDNKQTFMAIFKI